MGLRAFRNFTNQPAKLGLVIPPGALITTDSTALAEQLDAEGHRQGVRPEGAERAAADGSEADAAETKTKRAKRAKPADE